MGEARCGCCWLRTSGGAAAGALVDRLGGERVWVVGRVRPAPDAADWRVARHLAGDTLPRETYVPALLANKVNVGDVSKKLGIG